MIAPKTKWGKEEKRVKASRMPYGQGCADLRSRGSSELTSVMIGF
ncbi:hypothetical protein ACVLD2_001766 [Paenibacillus sp. PvR052]